MEECVICSRASEGAELYSLSSGQLIKSIARPTTTQTTATPTTRSTNTTSLLQSRDQSSPVLARISSNPARAGLTTVTLNGTNSSSRFIPPIGLTCVTFSSGGNYIAGGTTDGSILIWELDTGTLLTTIDAHYQSITRIEFTNDDGALVAASKDGAVTVWSTTSLAGRVGGVVSATPYCRLSDHTLAISAIAIGLGNFPNLRLLTASDDNTAKLWDLSVDGGSLLSTFAFESPVTHLAWDKLERFFFAVTSNEKGSTLRKMNLYRKRTQVGYDLDEPVGGGGRGDVQLATDGTEYKLNTDVITAIHLSAHSSALVVGTQSSAIHVLALPSLLPTRIIPPPPTTTPQGEITFLSTIIRPVTDHLDGTLVNDSNSTSLERPLMSGGMGRVIRPVEWAQNGGQGGRKVSLKLGSSLDVRHLLQPLAPVAGPVHSGRVATSSSDSRSSELEEEVSRLRAQLAKAVGLNEAMWKKVVEAGLEGV